MKNIHFKQILNEIISLAKTAILGKIWLTTKHISVKPNRHTLAIFMPNSTGIKPLSLLSTDNVLAVYGGLIGQNKIPFLGNMPSRICAVVETCQPFLWLAKFTKHIGTTMKTNSLAILATLSIDKSTQNGQNNSHSQKLIAVKPYRPTWLFYCLKPMANPSYTQNLPNRAVNFRPFMLWLILQNKPIGEYAERLLLVPRVKPQHPFMGKLLKKLIGTTMKTIKNPLISKLTPVPLVARFILGLVFGLPIACLAIGILAVMEV